MGDRFFGLHLDFFGFLASFLCAIHCAAIPLVIAVGFLGGLTWISDPGIELAFLLTSVIIAGLTLINGYRKQTIDPIAMILFGVGFTLLIISRLLPHLHGVDALVTVLGGLSIASAHIFHWLNLRKKSAATVVVR